MLYLEENLSVVEVERLKAVKGCGTSLITLSFPIEDLEKVKQMISNEILTASCIKSNSNRNSLLSALALCFALITKNMSVRYIAKKTCTVYCGFTDENLPIEIVVLKKENSDPFYTLDNKFNVEAK